MTRYLEVFFRHKFQLLGLLALCLLASTAVVAISPRNYQATANLWFTQPPLIDASPLVSTQTSADQGSAIFRELLNSKEFAASVGRDGTLAQYFADTGNIPTNDPITPIVHWLERKPKPTGDALTAQVNNGVFITLQKHVTVTPVEPNEVSLAFDFSDPTIATKTLQALIDNFQAKVKDYAQAASAGQVDLLTKQVNDQTAVVNADSDKISTYLAQHPEIRSNPQTDATYARYFQTLGQDTQAVTALKQKLDQAKQALADVNNASPYGFRYLDKPQAPTASTGLLKTALLGVGGGLGVGLLLIAAVCFLMVAADNTVMRAGDVPKSPGIRVIGEVPLLRSSAVLITPPPKALPPRAD